METWSLEHPEHGTITLECGYDDEFRDLYPDWPGEEQLTTPPGHDTGAGPLAFFRQHGAAPAKPGR